MPFDVYSSHLGIYTKTAQWTESVSDGVTSYTIEIPVEDFSNNYNSDDLVFVQDFRSLLKDLKSDLSTFGSAAEFSTILSSFYADNFEKHSV